MAMLSEARARPSSGYVNAFARENQLLPGDWRQLAAVDHRRIARALERYSTKRASLATLEACLMVRALITTGRSFDLLASLSFRQVSAGAAVAGLPPALIRRGRYWSWWLRSGEPDLKKVPDRAGMEPTSPHLWLPVSVGFLALMQRCLILRAVQPSAAMLPLLATHPEVIRKRVEAILASRPLHDPKARRSASTIESTERWLLRTISQKAGSDVGAASLITGRKQALARSMTYYGALKVPKAIAMHAAATRVVDKHSHGEYPSELAAVSIGDPTTPTDKTVQTLSQTLASKLTQSQDVASIHHAMTDYTCALVSFALALRGRGALPDYGSIDRRTGFCQIHDKNHSDPHQARMVWVPNVARDQLQMYAIHLEKLADQLSAEARAEIDKWQCHSKAAAPLFRVPSLDRLDRIDLKGVLLSTKEAGWRGRENAGRHWLRAKLTGRCSAETLGAFFGHWHHGVEPWGLTSSLDPLAYRADLERSLDPIMSEAGWRAMASPFR